MDFSPILASGETISSHSCSLSLYVGVTEPSGMLSGSTSLSGSTVAQTVTGGTAAHVYRLRFSVLTSAGRVLAASSFLPIDEDD
jgi:hypothetical protein